MQMLHSCLLIAAFELGGKNSLPKSSDVKSMELLSAKPRPSLVSHEMVLPDADKAAVLTGWKAAQIRRTVMKLVSMLVMVLCNKNA